MATNRQIGSGAQTLAEAGSDKPLSKKIALYASLWPCILGLSLSRFGIAVSSYGSYASTDAAESMIGSTVITVVIMGGVLLLVAAMKPLFSRRSVRILGIVCIIAGSLALFSLAGLALLGYGQSMVWLVVSAVSMIAVAGAIYYWIRRARGSNGATAAVLVFSAIFLSEIMVFPITLIPEVAGYLVAGFATLMQLPCMWWSRKRMRRFRRNNPGTSNDYFGFAHDTRSNTRLLATTAIGIGCLGIVAGLLREYPDGIPIVFTSLPRLLCSVLMLVICLVIIIHVLQGKRRILTVGIWIIMQASAYLALLLYSLFPNALQYGAVFAMLLNVLILGFNLYVTIAFMSYGWRDSLYYTLGGWIAWLGGHVLGSVILLALSYSNVGTSLVNVVVGGVLLVSALVVFVQFSGIASGRGMKKEILPKQNAIERVMGLDDSRCMNSLRQAAMKESATEMGKQFLLSKRETEVLVLYALGFTQKRVAEELFITAGTVHGHIKRIYMKTDLHSRQQILDYMSKYTA